MKSATQNSALTYLSCCIWESNCWLASSPTWDGHHWHGIPGWKISKPAMQAEFPNCAARASAEAKRWRRSEAFCPLSIVSEGSFFSRKTFRRRVLQKIVGVSHTTHIPHISHTAHIPHISITPHISHTYPSHHTYPTHIHSKRIPPIRIPPVRIHAMRIHSKRLHQQVLQYVSHQYVSHQYVSVQQVSHQYVSMLCVSIQCVSIQKVCISRNRKRIPPIHIPPIRIFNTYPTSTDPFNAYPFKKFASAGMAMSMSIIAYHFIPLLLGGNGNEYGNLAFPSISLQNY